jgi:hypothetical protein
MDKIPVARERRLDRFLKLPRYPFTRAMIEHAPEEPGVFGLFDGDELVYVGKAVLDGLSIKDCLLLHQDGVRGGCTMRATSYTWEISLWPAPREKELLAGFQQRAGRDPRCQNQAA